MMKSLMKERLPGPVAGIVAGPDGGLLPDVVC
jgi:hypothetical protein